MWNLLMLLGGAYVLGKVWAGQQWIISQPSDTVWISDPHQTDSIGQPGTGFFSVGSLPPGEAPPWRIASESEAVLMAQLEEGM